MKRKYVAVLVPVLYLTTWVLAAYFDVWVYWLVGTSVTHCISVVTQGVKVFRYCPHDKVTRVDGNGDLVNGYICCDCGEEVVASGSHADIRIVEVPDNIEWQIEEYDGLESVHEKHRSW